MKAGSIKTKKFAANKPVFMISLADLQNEAMERIGRKLTDEEIDQAKDGLEWGLLTAIDVVYGAIFEGIEA